MKPSTMIMTWNKMKTRLLLVVGPNVLAINNHYTIALKMKEWTISLFKYSKLTHNEDETLYFYIITIPKIKTKLFSLVIWYIVCRALFSITSNIINKTYKVFFSPLLCSCTSNNMSSFFKMICTINSNVYLNYYIICGHSNWCLTL